MNKKCKIVINKTCGSYKTINIEQIATAFATGYDVVYDYIDGDNFVWNVKNIDKLIVCGGDGTLNNAINACKDNKIDIVYCPFGTFNELSKNNKNKEFSLKRTGNINGRLFSYVVATGTFTPLGYTVDDKKKQRLKVFAYLTKVFHEYKVNEIFADIKVDTHHFNEAFTLIMVIQSKRCFGFKFNKLYKCNADNLHLLLIKSPGKNNIINKIKIFFPFFRAFFIGFKKPVISKNLTFIPFKHLEMKLSNKHDFCIDGEKLCPNSDIVITMDTLSCEVKVIPKQQLKTHLNKTQKKQA